MNISPKFCAGAALLALMGLATQSSTAQQVVELSTLPFNQGFRMDGLVEGDLLGINTDKLGDFNGDGIDDFLVSAEESQGGRGSTYVVFGRDGGFPAGLNLGTLNGSNGFRLDGGLGEGFNNRARHAGDVNDDDRDDLILGLSSGNGFDGRACILYGRESFPSGVISLDGLGPGTITCMDGAQQFENVGKAVTALGDFNGDLIDDVAIGTGLGDFAGNESGSVYVVFGKSPNLDVAITLEALDGTDGFRIDGASESDFFGISVSGGDINGDGLADLIAGADEAGTPGAAEGAAYVVFGKTGPHAATMSVSGLNGVNGFRLSRSTSIQWVGRSVGAGDFNGDRVDDVLVGSLKDRAYVVFGKRTAFNAVQDLATLDGSVGFVIEGDGVNDRAGEAVGNAGDFNADGIEDIGLGAQFADANGNNSGKVYVVYGTRAARPASMMLGTLPSSVGIEFRGAAVDDYCGLNVGAAGDVNHDYGSDLIFSCHVASTLGLYRGAAYVVYGAVPPYFFKDGFDE